MKPDPTVAVAIIAFLGSLVSIIMTNRYAARSARAAQESAEKQKAVQVDAESFKRARENYDAAIDEQGNRIERLRVEMEHEADECKRRITGLQRDMTSLKEWSRPLLGAARAAGLRVSEPPVWLGDTEPHGIEEVP
jgi:hypothetical protein